MARKPMPIDQEERAKKRRESAALLPPSIELEAFLEEGDRHQYAGATKEEHITKKSDDRIVIPRKAEENKLIKKQIRLHPKMIKAISLFAENDHKDFAEATRHLLTQALKAKSIEI